MTDTDARHNGVKIRKGMVKPVCYGKAEFIKRMLALVLIIKSHKFMCYGNEHLQKLPSTDKAGAKFLPYGKCNMRSVCTKYRASKLSPLKEVVFSFSPWSSLRK